MNKVEEMIAKCSQMNACRNGRFIPNQMDRTNAVVKVYSGSKSEIQNIENEVKRYNEGTKNAK